LKKEISAFCSEANQSRQQRQQSRCKTLLAGARARVSVCCQSGLST
jgi:hypothetical protein